MGMKICRKESKRQGRIRQGRVGAAVYIFAGIVPLTGVLWLWTIRAEQDIHYTPEYEKENMVPYLDKMEVGALTSEEYDVLYRQTGLSREAIDSLNLGNRMTEIFDIQDRFFEHAETKCECHFFLFREKLCSPCGRCDENCFIPVVENGDILITFSSHFLGWRNGHAGIVVDAENGLVLEALTLGSNSAILPLDGWADRPSFALLRLRGVPEAIRREIAAYAREELVDVPYRLSAGIFSSLREEYKFETESAESMRWDGKQKLSGTHCAHLIWYAYEQFGYDLDSDGGVIVTPRDLYESPLLEVIQVYGMAPKKADF